MNRSPLAGRKAPRSLLIDVPRLVTDYYAQAPDPSVAAQRVSFGTSGHRGTSEDGTFNEDHILAICQAIADRRKREGLGGPLFLGSDTHALSTPALVTALEVLTANGVSVVAAKGFAPVPTPVISHAILTHNLATGQHPAMVPASRRADGVVVTPSHNPPNDGGFKYNPPHGGPADSDETGEIQQAANAYLEAGLTGVKRQSLAKARASGAFEERDLVAPFVNDLGSVVDMEAISAAGVRVGVDPLGGSSLAYWNPIAERWKLDLTLVNDVVDPTFSFMPVDHDGKIRMDCSSPDAMANLIHMQHDFDVAFGNDPDADRHGIVTPSHGLMNPNHYLAVAIEYLFTHRSYWPGDAKVGKTLVSSSMIDKVAESLGREVAEVPVGFKWFVQGLLTSAYGFAGEESAGAAFLRKDGAPWTTDKDGLILGLLACEIKAKTGEDPGQRYAKLTARFGDPAYARIDVPASKERKKVLGALTAEALEAAGMSELAGEKIVKVMSKAPANGEPIGGIKVITENGWFAARPSGTEDVYKIYGESFAGEERLAKLQDEARALVQDQFERAGV
ncbi:MAG: phosphoglucomutase (alpha-D-glucose-1,6-bisphosphate-dependent) [Trueperaceae bacterium]|jgi:phosphoglucomutase|nr:phosphoglucomutase (alpha-D-glucose-1,6-bisphosphate-dependent) [Truepera sp.]HRN17533.1 phosphoglucomutase (alpha-D-glucose-1,6-bisphosphate-dependent) [Trueperaceae bacterium]HRQ11045.1 phosphoglucomutase (alpha-D-glucose-1,6-bisphosphate-dependent) [Trueperaceae bacterium]